MTVILNRKKGENKCNKTPIHIIAFICFIFNSFPLNASPVELYKSEYLTDRFAAECFDNIQKNEPQFIIKAINRSIYRLNRVHNHSDKTGYYQDADFLPKRPDNSDRCKEYREIYASLHHARKYAKSKCGKAFLYTLGIKSGKEALRLWKIDNMAGDKYIGLYDKDWLREQLSIDKKALRELDVTKKIDNDGFISGFIFGLFSIIGYPLAAVDAIINQDSTILKGYFMDNWIGSSNIYIFGNILGLLFCFSLIAGIKTSINKMKGHYPD